MRLVVGLGNPGSQYRRTRHNAGYMVLSELAGCLATGKPKARFHGDLIETHDEKGAPLLLLCPTTYMNRSGLSVLEAVRFYKIPLENLLIVCDDLNLPFSRLRFRSEGGSGGQKGLADILRVLGTEKISRLRVGIGSPPGQMDAADFVLMNFTEKELPEWSVTVKEASDAVRVWLNSGTAEAMNKYNGK